MPKCPQCTKPLRELARRCPSCQADLDLLLDYVSHLGGGLERAENLTRAGELGQAVWAYLEVLEVDPDNPTARGKIGQVVTAVRQFDAVTPSRRWASNLPPAAKQTRWDWRYFTGAGIAVVLALLAGILIGWMLFGPGLGAGDDNPDPAPQHQDQQLGASLFRDPASGGC